MKSVRKLKKGSYAEDDVDNEGTWAISYGDMITLLLSFFVIFFTHDPKQQKLEKMNRHLTYQIENLVPAEISKPEEKIEVVKVKMPNLNNLVMDANEVGENIVVTFKATSFFKSGSLIVDKLGEDLLQDFARKYLPYAGNYRLAIKGFTDKRKVKKLKYRKYEDNLELSALRSLSAMRVLQKSGIPLNSMEIAGAGELELINKVLPNPEGLTKKELEAYSRTVVLVIRPVKESW